MGRKKLIEDEELLNHARAVFLEKGATASTKDIAKAAGISQATLFQRFPTKEALFRAAMVPPTPDVEQIIAAAQGHTDPRSALTAICEAMLAYFRSMIPVALHLMIHPAITMQDMQGQFKKNNPAILGQTLALFLRNLNQTRQAAIRDPVAAAGLLVAAIHSLALFELMGLHGGYFPTDAIAALINSLWYGMEPAAQIMPAMA